MQAALFYWRQRYLIHRGKGVALCNMPFAV
jgi:hypothetical protein